jgi:hypothetical protein
MVSCICFQYLVDVMRFEFSTTAADTWNVFVQGQDNVVDSQAYNRMLLCFNHLSSFPRIFSPCPRSPVHRSASSATCLLAISSLATFLRNDSLSSSDLSFSSSKCSTLSWSRSTLASGIFNLGVKRFHLGFLAFGTGFGLRVECRVPCSACPYTAWHPRCSYRFLTTSPPTLMNFFLSFCSFSFVEHYSILISLNESNFGVCR